MPLVSGIGTSMAAANIAAYLVEPYRKTFGCMQSVEMFPCLHERFLYDILDIIRGNPP
jgi:hypothetical protein